MTMSGIARKVLALAGAVGVLATLLALAAPVASATGAAPRPGECAGTAAQAYADAVPPLPAPGASSTGLRLAIHGYLGSANDMKPLADAAPTPGWDSFAYNWSVLAGSTYSGNVPPSVDPARRVGRCLAYDVAAASYGSVHLIAHSLGAWVADALADELRVLGSTAFVQATLLDAYGLASDDLGDSADFTEHYVHTRAGVAETDALFPSACNFNLDALSTTTDIVKSHNYPVQYYLETMQGGRPGASGFGWPLSLEASATPPGPGDCPQGSGGLLRLPINASCASLREGSFGRWTKTATFKLKVKAGVRVTVTFTPDSASNLDGALKAKPPPGVLFDGSVTQLTVDAAAGRGAETLSFVAPAKGTYRITASRIGRPPGAYTLGFACE